MPGRKEGPDIAYPAPCQTRGAAETERLVMTKTDVDQSEASNSKPEADTERKPEPKAEHKAEAKTVAKPGSKVDAKDDLKSLPLAEVEKKLARRRTASRKPRRRNG